MASLHLLSRSAEGEHIAEVAKTLPPIPLGGFSKSIQAISYIVCALATIVVALRVYVRVKLSASKAAWGYDDLFAVMGWVPLIPSLVFLILATYWGLGAHDSQVPDGQIEFYQVRVKGYMFIFEMIYFASSVLTKVAMAIMILRLSSARIYSIIIWGNMGLVALNGLVCVVVMFASCTPIQALWNEKLGYCRIRDGWIIVSYVGSVVLAVVDWTCAITPFFMLRSLQMPRRRKISVQLILSLGVIGSAAGLVRMGYYHAYDTVKYPNESLHTWGHTILWSILEAGLGIIACSLPPLRKLFKKFYQSSTGGSGMMASIDGGTQLSSLHRKDNKVLRRGEGKSQWDRLDDEHSESSQQHIVKSTLIQVESTSADHDLSRAEHERKHFA